MVQIYTKSAGRLADRLYEAGLELFSQADYDAAISNLHEAIRLESEKSHYYLLRGKAYLKKGYFETALRDFRLVLSREQGCQEAEKWAGKCAEILEERVEQCRAVKEICGYQIEKFLGSGEGQFIRSGTRRGKDSSSKDSTPIEWRNSVNRSSGSIESRSKGRGTTWQGFPIS